jgi:predicted DsbA family dithiol-disulfide isomerase
VCAIEIYADVWCPFAHVGLHYVVARRADQGRDDVLLDIRAWPLELVNGTPLNPAVVASHVQELRSRVTPHLFGGFDPTQFPQTSLPALAYAHAAYRSSPKMGETMSLALRDALFEQGLDISRPRVLSDIAGELDVNPPDSTDEMAVLRDWEDGIRRGVKGSPHFFCGAADAFCPSLDISRSDNGHLTVKNDMVVLDRFLTNCFGS